MLGSNAQIAQRSAPYVVNIRSSRKTRKQNGQVSAIPLPPQPSVSQPSIGFGPQLYQQNNVNQGNSMQNPMQNGMLPMHNHMIPAQIQQPRIQVGGMPQNISNGGMIGNQSFMNQTQQRLMYPQMMGATFSPYSNQVGIVSQNTLYLPIPIVEPDATNEVVVLHEAGDDLNAEFIPNSVISIDIPSVLETGSLNFGQRDGRHSELKLNTKLQQSFCIGICNRNDNFIVSILREFSQQPEDLKVQIRIWGVNERKEEQFRNVCLRNTDDLSSIFVGRMQDCVGLKTIFCKLEIAYTPTEIVMTNRLDRDHILDQQVDAFDKEEFADLKIIVGAKKFMVSKVFLCVHSEVFRAMLSGQTAENISKEIIIDDLDADIVEVMLRYLYTGQVHKLRTYACELYVVADRYQIVKLQDICLNSIYENLDLSLILHCLELAFAFDRLETFRERVVGFAIANIQQIKRLSDWKDFAKSHPEVAVELIDRMNP